MLFIYVYTHTCTCSPGPKCSGKNGKWRYVFHCFAALGRRFILVRASKPISWLCFSSQTRHSLKTDDGVVPILLRRLSPACIHNSPAAAANPIHFASICRWICADSLRNRFKWRSYFNLNSALCYYNQFNTIFSTDCLPRSGSYIYTRQKLHNQRVLEWKTNLVSERLTWRAVCDVARLGNIQLSQSERAEMLIWLIIYADYTFWNLVKRRWRQHADLIMFVFCEWSFILIFMLRLLYLDTKYYYSFMETRLYNKNQVNSMNSDMESI